MALPSGTNFLKGSHSQIQLLALRVGSGGYDNLSLEWASCPSRRPWRDRHNYTEKHVLFIQQFGFLKIPFKINDLGCLVFSRFAYF
jgi:hypothetical protein